MNNAAFQMADGSNIKTDNGSSIYTVNNIAKNNEWQK